jgi:hypothetical protein
MAINRNSTVAECLADPRATKIINDITGNFGPENELLGPVSGMKLSTLLKFPQGGVSREDQKKIMEALDALDA